MKLFLGCLDYLSVLMKSKIYSSFPKMQRNFNSGLWFSFFILLCFTWPAPKPLLSSIFPSRSERLSGKSPVISVVVRAEFAQLRCGMPLDGMLLMRIETDSSLNIFGGFQVQMFGGETSLVRDVLNLCLVRHPAAQKAAVHVHSLHDC